MSDGGRREQRDSGSEVCDEVTRMLGNEVHEEVGRMLNMTVAEFRQFRPTNVAQERAREIVRKLQRPSGLQGAIGGFFMWVIAWVFGAAVVAGLLYGAIALIHFLWRIT